MTTIHAAVTAVYSVAVLTVASTAPILGDGDLRTWVVVGALGGAFLAVTFNYPQSVKDAAVRWLGSAFTSFLASPWVVLTLTRNEEIRAESVLFVSGIIAFLAWVLLGLVQKVAPAWVRKRLGLDKED